MMPRCSGWFSAFALAAVAGAAEPLVRTVAPVRTATLVSSAERPAEFRYLAFPSVLRTSPDEVWIAFKAGRSHATDAGAAMEVVRHTLSNGETRLLQRVAAPVPKLYQMGEWVRHPDGSIDLCVDVQEVGWDGRHYRSGAETLRWNAGRGSFEPARPMPPVAGVPYGYPLDFIVEGPVTWQLVMAFGYHRPGGRWSVDVIRSEDSGGSWAPVRNLTEEFGGIRANESAFVRHGDGFVVATRGYDRIARLHRTDGRFRLLRQADLTGRHPFVNGIIGRPRLWLRDGSGYLLGRNWTRPAGAAAGRPEGAGEMQLCLLRFDPETLALLGCVILDNADQRKVTDGYYAVPVLTGEGAGEQLHVITYKGANGRAPDIVRLDYLWSAVK